MRARHFASFLIGPGHLRVSSGRLSSALSFNYIGKLQVCRGNRLFRSIFCYFHYIYWCLAGLSLVFCFVDGAFPVSSRPVFTAVRRTAIGLTTFPKIRKSKNPKLTFQGFTSKCVLVRCSYRHLKFQASYS